MAILVNAGRAILTNRIKGAGTEPLNVGWGTGTTAEAATQTALTTEVETPRVAGVSSQVTTSVTNDTYQVVGTRTAGSGETIAEVGLFDATTAGNMLIRAVFTGLALNINDQITFTIKLQFS